MGCVLLSLAETAVAQDEAPLTPSAASAPNAAAAEMLFFEDHLAPLLERHCYDCHNPEDREGQLDLTTASGLLTGSESGPVVTARNREHSLLYEVVHGGEMPPEGEPLSASEIDLIGAWIAGGARFRDPPVTAAQPLSQHDVLPILLLRCTACHGAQLQRGGLDLRSIAGVRQGSENGAVAVAGDPDASSMIRRVEQQLCPPNGELLKYFVERPGDSEIQKLRAWIAAGMPEQDAPQDEVAGLPDPLVSDQDRQRWAFQPLPKKIAVPVFDRPSREGGREGDTLEQPIDAFVYRGLVEHGLEFSSPAKDSELVRRVYLGLLGLPPSAEELQRWLESPSDRWYEAMVEELLASPRYGERWGRYWLDVAGYADSEGGQSEDPVRKFAWKYRDYVIRSLNADKPWDRFLLEQLAGDELTDYRDPAQVTEETVENLIATGFLRMGVDETGSRTMNFVPERLGLIADALNVVSTGVMGLTLECARCHSHKYDPIPQSDYYRFKAIFQGAFDEHDWMSWKTRQLDVASPEMIAHREAVNAPLEKELKELESNRKSLLKIWQDRQYDERWPKIDKEKQQEILAAIKVNAGRRTLRQGELVAFYDREVRPVESVLVDQHPEFARELENIDQRVAALRERLLPPFQIRALWDRGRPSPTYMLIRGEYDRPGRLVAPGVPAVLTDGKTPFVPQPPWPGANSTGRRLALARWLTSDDHPLTARVIVNRTWSQHFGVGIVKTLDNFGNLGAEPTHPELLDWLARDFVDSGWSLKSLHRKILLSKTYRQSSARTPERDRIDPENQWLSRMSLRRLDAEALRDSLLAVSERLDDRMYGPPSSVTVREDGLIMERPSRSGQLRRSLYLQLRRTELPTLLSTFDYPEMQPNCIERSTSTVSTQSLILLNNGRIYELAGDFARRVLDHCGDAGEAAMVDHVYCTAFSRLPTAEERGEAMQALTELRQNWRESGAVEDQVLHLALTTFCHTIMNAAEFRYVD